MQTLENRWSLAAAALALLAAAPAAAKNHTYIAPGDAFLLGGQQKTTVHVTGRNVGAVPVELAAGSAGATAIIGTVEPGKPFDHDFAAGETAIVRNSSRNRAVVSFDLTPAVSALSMGYALPQR